MATKNGSQAATDSGRDRLREALTSYLGAKASNMAGSLGDRVSGITDTFNDAADNGGTLAGVASRVMGGESPLKSMVAEKAKGAKDTLVGKARELVGGGSMSRGDTKVTNIVEAVDVGVPLRMCYNHWTNFEDFSSFMKGVQSVSFEDEDGTSDWKAKVLFSNREWKATVQEQIPDDRIMWTSEGSQATTRGAVSFHELGPNLTRIVVVVEYYPSGFVEKTGNLWRAQGRRLRLDLKHFQRHVTLSADEEEEGWRGEIRDGEVVRSHEDVTAEEEEEGRAEEGEDDAEEERE